MIVFKNYFNIVKRHLGIIIMFSAISIGVSVINTSYTSTEDYVSVEPKIAVINYDESSLSNNFVDYITERAEIVEVEDNEKAIQDSLYLNKVDSILIIPDNFGANLLMGNEPNVKIKKSTQNVSEYTELLVNRYFKIAENYSKVGMTENEIINNYEEAAEERASASQLDYDVNSIIVSFDSKTDDQKMLQQQILVRKVKMSIYGDGFKYGEYSDVVSCTAS